MPQVHKAIMIVGGKRRSVVVKVRHPGVEVRIKQDFQILKPLAAAASQVDTFTLPFGAKQCRQHTCLDFQSYIRTSVVTVPVSAARSDSQLENLHCKLLIMDMVIEYGHAQMERKYLLDLLHHSCITP